MVSRAPITQEFDIKNPGWSRFISDVSDTLGPPNRDFGSITPVFSGLTGDPAENSGDLYFVRHGKMLFFDLLIVPDTTTASTLGTTYFELPELLPISGRSLPGTAITAQGYGTLNAINVQTPQDLGQGFVEMSTRKAYLPEWVAQAGNIAVTGWVRIEGL